jgi:hypothetical protein
MSRLTPRLVFYAAVLLAFTAWSTTITVEHGYFGFLRLALSDPWGGQIFVDLCIALSLVVGWLRRDARRTGISPWLYYGLTVALGSIGPLAYLVHREWKAGGGVQGAGAHSV